MPQYDAFLSYARDDDQRPDGSRADWSKPDESFMCRLYEALTKAGLNIWWDREKLPSRGLSFSNEIRDAINNSRRLVLVIGPHAVLGGTDKAGQPIMPKEWVQKEIEHAQTYCIGISPILRLGDYDALQKTPYEFRKIARGDIPDFRNDADFDRAVKQLIRQLQGEVAPMGALHGVPLLPTYYIKRQAVLDELEAKIRLDSDNVTIISAQGRQPTTDEQAVAVQGMGGIGKSTLAAATAHDCDVRRMFPDGVYWVELKQTPNLALRQADLGARFGDDINEYPDEQRGKQRLSALLADKRALIILDDVWQKAHADAFLVRAPRCCFLLTTRLQTLVDELDLRQNSEVKLKVLTDEEAIQLIEARLGVEAKAQHDTFRQLNTLLEGHTLALSLAAARLAKKGAAAAPEYLASLQRRLSSERPFFELDKLDEKQNKQLSVEVTLKESYEALSEGMQRRFRLLGIFAPDGTFDAQAAAAIWEEPAEDAPEYLQVLVDAALLTRADATEDGRYDQHALLRAHARARMTEDERTQTFDRYADYYTAQASQFWKLPPEDWGGLEPNQPDIHHLGDTLVKLCAGDARYMKRGLEFAYNITRYLRYRRQVRRLEWLELGLQSARQLATAHPEEIDSYRRRESLFLAELGSAWSALGEKRKALDFYEQALSRFHGIGDRGGEATTLNNIGLAWDALGEKRKALDFYEQALSLYRDVGDRRGEATTLNNIGLAWDALGEKRKALDFYEQALSLYRNVGDRGGEATTLNNIGKVWADLGEKRKALDFYEQALPQRRAVGDRGGEAATLNNIGKVWADLGEKRKALDFFEQALSLFRDLGDRGGETTTLNNISYFYFQAGDLPRVVDTMEQIITIVQHMGAVGDESLFRFNLAVVFEQMNRLPEAIAQVEQSIQIQQSVGLPQDAAGYTIKVKEGFLAELRGEPAPSESGAGAVSTLPAETVQTLCANTVAVRTAVPDKLDEWQAQLTAVRADWLTQGPDWEPEVAFVEALLAVLRGESPVLAESNPYAGVVAQVVAAVGG